MLPETPGVSLPQPGSDPRGVGPRAVSFRCGKVQARGRHRRERPYADRVLPRRARVALRPEARRDRHQGRAGAGQRPGRSVGEVYMGCVLPAGVGQAPARQAALCAGLPSAVAVRDGQQGLRLGPRRRRARARSAIARASTRSVVAGGMESMSNAPHLLRKARATATKMGPLEIVDSMVNDGLWDSVHEPAHGQLRRAVREGEGTSRARAGRVRRRELSPRARRAEGGPVQGRDRRRSRSPTRRATIDGRRPTRSRAAATSRSSPSLRTAFQKDGTITAGNASSINDGARGARADVADEATARGCKVARAARRRGASTRRRPSGSRPRPPARSRTRSRRRAGRREEGRPLGDQRGVRGRVAREQPACSASIRRR